MDKPRIFFGTGNGKKLTEIDAILGAQFDIQSFRDLPAKLEVIEDAPDLEGNAIKKAKSFYEVVGMPCFADDTGLEVAALDGRPGVYSARYAGEDGDSEANMQLLLKELADKDDRSAQFRTVIAYYDGASLHTFEGILKGRIGLVKRGGGGFGYDPLFIPENDERTLAEMTSDEKNTISHRGKAVRNFAEFIL
ncbi:UNVERIFIED_CONTAM: hypothetical protein GTU68_029115 [Idotea baltica]|nr:hypothetical protein [Idotea baltica]